VTTINIRKLLFTIAVSVGCSVVSSPAWVAAAPQQGCDCSNQSCTTCRQSGGCVHCPECSESFVPPPQEYCELEISEGKESKTCFEIDYKTICIPKVVPPWRQCCEPICAEARSVKVLKTKKYECPVCNYKWTVKKPEYQQPATGNPTTFNQTPEQSLPVNQNASRQLNYGPTFHSGVPIIPSGSSVPVVPARPASAPSFIVPTTPVIPPAPPTSGSIGDYFGGR
jgi:hypothetical protein